MGQQSHGPAAQQARQPPGLLGRQRAQQHGDRGSQHQGQWRVHPDQQVLEHVAADVLMGERRDRRQQGQGQQGASGEEGRRAPPV
jgi:hypothetical protein